MGIWRTCKDKSMREHHTKNKGDYGVLKAQVDLFSKGWLPLIPLTEHSEFDLAAYNNGKFLRIQVKYRTLTKGKIELLFKSSWADKNGNHLVKTNKSEVDLICIYCPDTEKCYYVDLKKYNSGISLRLDPTKNGQKKSIHYLKDFEAMPL